ncbi:hypothetical protein GGS23DRAFT_596221 [Durotheca rogersii]|uniref:uncharacterized protein n=1 Tax=Durotheca rogersii TaxID=419775 RepID=UPI00222090C8|nr:uncharacterized protein GGS23DRAFT_596221 [Durotheca rogersii]KAI5863717.1 hypothetical protein GGS23DRAFT_596221 [Durotheca rogersii]
MLEALMRLCAAKGMHLVNDEIYAPSAYARDDRAAGESEAFVSVRAINPIGFIDPARVHVLYGSSKDFGAGGMRFGCLVSENETMGYWRRRRNHGPRIQPLLLASQFSMDLAT